MSEVDLIPTEFRRTQLLRKRLKACAIGYVAMVVLLLTAKLWLGYNLKIENKWIETLKAEENSILQQRQTYDELQTKRKRLEEYLGILKTLRGGPKAEQMFVVIDRAINDSVWISNLKFLRAGEKTASPPQRQNVGYMVVVPKGEATQEDQWTNDIRMEISGQALSHSALADFVNGLQDQKEIVEVKLQSTTENKYMSGFAISYQISVRVGSSPGGS